MGTSAMKVGLIALSIATTLLVLERADLAAALDPYSVASTTFYDAKATFYGGQDASGTMNGGCGYTNPFTLGYGAQTAALSSALFNKGLTCGACFEIKCKRSASAYAAQWCYPNVSPIVITATNLCPQGSNGGWCDAPKYHFDLAFPAFTRLANQNAGVIPVQYRRVPCRKYDGIKFLLNGNPNWLLVLVYNVGGWGNVNAMAVKGSNTGFISMSQSWGQNWQSWVNLTGQTLTFRVTLGNGKTVTFWNVAPTSWQLRQTYAATYNFY